MSMICGEDEMVSAWSMLAVAILEGDSAFKVTYVFYDEAYCRTGGPDFLRIIARQERRSSPKSRLWQAVFT